MDNLALTPKEMERVLAPINSPIIKYAVLLAYVNPAGEFGTWHGAIGSTSKELAILCARAVASAEGLSAPGHKLAWSDALDVEAALQAPHKPITAETLAERRAA